MKLFRLLILFSLIGSSTNMLKAQEHVMASLRQALKEATTDTARCRVLNVMIEAEGDDNIWPEYNDELHVICEEGLKKYHKGDALYLFYLKYMAASLNNEGYLANVQGDMEKALRDFEKSKKADNLPWWMARS